jgi:hypothetical protein
MSSNPALGQAVRLFFVWTVEERWSEDAAPSCEDAVPSSEDAVPSRNWLLCYANGLTVRYWYRLSSRHKACDRRHSYTLSFMPIPLHLPYHSYQEDE